MIEHQAHRVAVIGGDGIGPEVTAAALEVVRAAGVRVDTVEFTLGAARYLRDGFVLQDHRRLRHAPHLLLSDRVQRRYPQLACDIVEDLFTVTNPEPKPGIGRLVRRRVASSGVRLRHLAADSWRALRTFG